jgi:hypothetical protein
MAQGAKIDGCYLASPPLLLCQEFGGLLDAVRREKLTGYEDQRASY